MGRAACFDGGGHAKVVSHVWHASIKCTFFKRVTYVCILYLFLTKLVAGQSKSSSKVLYQNLLMPPGGFTDILQYIKVCMVLIKVGKLEANLFKHMTFFFHTSSSTVLQYIHCAKC